MLMEDPVKLYISYYKTMNYQNQNTYPFDTVLDIKKIYNNPTNAPLIFEATVSVIQIESMGDKATRLMNQTITLLIRIWNEYRTFYFIEQILNLLVQIMPHPVHVSKRISDTEYSTLLTDLSMKMLQYDKTDMNKNEHDSQTIFKVFEPQDFVDALCVYESPQSPQPNSSNDDTSSNENEPVSKDDESSYCSCEICIIRDCCFNYYDNCDDCDDFSSDYCDECGLNDNTCRCVETIIVFLQKKTE